MPDGAAGLACATCVLVVFTKAGIRLLNRPTWEINPTDPRRTEDRVHEERVAARVRSTAGAEAHAERVAYRAPRARSRAEEVAAATALTPYPVPTAAQRPRGERC